MALSLAEKPCGSNYKGFTPCASKTSTYCNLPKAAAFSKGVIPLRSLELRLALFLTKN